MWLAISIQWHVPRTHELRLPQNTGSCQSTYFTPCHQLGHNREEEFPNRVWKRRRRKKGSFATISHAFCGDNGCVLLLCQSALTSSAQSTHGSRDRRRLKKKKKEKVKANPSFFPMWWIDRSVSWEQTNLCPSQLECTGFHSGSNEAIK